MRALSNEIAKNLVLAGIGSLTVQDSDLVIEDDLGAQFFITEQDVGKNVCYPGVVHKELTLCTDDVAACRGSSAADTKAQPQGLSSRRHGRYQAQIA